MKSWNSAEQWEQIQPGGTTICVTGTPYAFFVRHGTSNNLLIYFQPGGAKIHGQSYDADNPGFDPSVFIPEMEETALDPHWDKDNPANMGGIFNLNDERNPFADYSIVFIPYCTGDLHWGNHVHEGFHHKGYINATTVLNWAYKVFPNPDRVFVAGSSAGAAGASYHLTPISTHYPNADIALLTDSLGGVRGKIYPSLEIWGADGVLLNTVGYDHLTLEQIAMTTPYILNGKRLPNTPIAQFNTTRDFAQTKVVEAFGVDATLVDALKANHTDIHAEIDNFHTYTADAEYHVVLRKNILYEEVTNGVPLYEWIQALADGKPLENVAPASFNLK